MIGRGLIAALWVLGCGCTTPGQAVGPGVETPTGGGTTVTDEALRACLARVPPEQDLPQTMEAMVLGVIKTGGDHFPALTRRAARPIDDAAAGYRALCRLYGSMGLRIDGYTERGGHFIYSVRSSGVGLTYLRMIYVKVGGRAFYHYWPRS